MEAYCRQLRLNIDDTEPMKFFVCENLECNSSVKEGKNRLSLFRNQKCGCGKVLNRVLSPPAENGFAKENATFIISDDLYVMPNVFGTVVFDILKLSLVTKTPLTDFFFKKSPFPLEFKQRKQSEYRIRE
ncbi:DUF674 family protein, partial [Trifolium medium]|nr:DUF674 family protein [Trifolium medium]